MPSAASVPVPAAKRCGRRDSRAMRRWLAGCLAGRANACPRTGEGCACTWRDGGTTETDRLAAASGQWPVHRAPKARAGGARCYACCCWWCARLADKIAGLQLRFSHWHRHYAGPETQDARGDSDGTDAIVQQQQGASALFIPRFRRQYVFS